MNNGTFMEHVIQDAELKHFGILGMKWGRRRSKPDSPEVKKKALIKADKEWEKNKEKHIAKAMSKLNNNEEYQKTAFSIATKLTKAGLEDQRLNDEFTKQVAPIMNRILLDDKESYNPSKTKVIGIITVEYNGVNYVKPDLISVDDIKKMKHSSKNDLDDSLLHYGIPGMKWGRRKGKVLLKNLNQKINPPKRGTSEDYKKAKIIRKKKLHQMSNAELKTLNERLQLERTYKDLSAKDISSGRKFSQNILRDVGKELVKETLKEGLKTGVKLGIKAVRKR